MTPTATTIRLAVTLTRSARRGAPVTAELRPDDHPLAHEYRGEGTTPAPARADLATLVRRTLANARHQPTLVIGGAGDYVDHLHVITPTPHGWTVHSVHHRRHSVSWCCFDTRDDALAAVLRHVGGEPTVLGL